MGIFRFWTYFKTNFSKHICNMKRTESFLDKKIKIDNLLIDMNGIFHSSCQKIHKYGSFKPQKSFFNKRELSYSKKQTLVFEDICEKINNIVSRTQPSKRVVLCIDGCAPFAKIIQQKARRYKTSLEKKENLTAGMEDNKFDSNCITPGTQFMHNLSKYIDWYVKKQISENSDWHNLEVIFSNEKVPSEGEHKLLNFLRLHGLEIETHIICGLDADLIMLSLGTHLPNFYLLREDTFDINNEYFIVNIGTTYKELQNKMNWDEEGKINNFSGKHSINDFIFMCFMIGNDFLPHIPSIEIMEGGVDEMINIYKNIGKSYGHLTMTTEKGVVFIKNTLQIFLNNIGMKEQHLIENKCQHKDKYFHDKILEQNLKYDEGKFCLDMDKYKSDYYAENFPEITDIKQICNEYIEGLQWVLTYYTKSVPKWDFAFQHHYAPFISDIAIHIKDYKQPIYRKTTPILPFVQLLCVLPPSSNQLLPSPLNEILLDKKSKISHLYPNDVKIDISGKKQAYEGVVLLPFVDQKLIIKEYDKVISKVKEADAKRNIVGKSYIYTFDKNTNYNLKSYYGDFLCKVNTKTIELVI